MESTFCIYRLCFQLSLNSLPKKWTFRIYFMFLMFFVMEISAAYLSGLSGVFTRPSLEPRITTRQEVFDSDIPFKVHLPTLTRLKRYVVENKRRPWPKSKFIIDDNYRHISLEETIYDLKHYIIYGICFDGVGQNKIGIVKDSPRQPYFFAFRKRMHLNNLINYHIKNAQETAISSFNGQRSVMDDRNFEDKEMVTVLNMDDVYGIFIIWLYGIGFASIAFTFEIIHYKREQRKVQILKLQV